MRWLAVPLLLLHTAGAMSEPTPALAGVFENLKAGEKQTAVVFGTSLTKDGAWVRLMQDWFDAKYPGQVTVVNSGGRGQNSAWGAREVEAGVLAHDPDLVFIEFSYNDAHQRFNLTPEQGRKNLDAIIQAILTRNPKTAIVLQTMNAPWDPPEGKGFADSAKNRPNLEAHNENYRAAAKQFHLALVDNHPDFLKIKETDFARYQSLVPDGSHPNQAGSKEVTWANVRALLEGALN